MNSKSKNIVLIIAFALLVFLCYKFAISKTIDIRKKYHVLKREESHYKNTPRQLSLLKQKEKYYDSILGKYQISKGSIQNNLLNVLTSFSEETNLKLIHFAEPHTELKEALSINTYRFILEGNYNSILKLIYRLEQKTKFGEIINLHFEKKIDFRKNRTYLQASVLLKSYG